MTKIIGHRGAAGLALENSPDSIIKALSLPLDGIEFDVQRTKDGKLILMHDWHTFRVARKFRRVADATLAELQAMPLKDGQRILSLDEALKIVGDKQTVVLDIKSYGVSEELERVLNRHPDVQVTISSRKYEELEKIHALMPDVPFLAQSHLNPTEIVHTAHQLGATGISLNKWLINPYTYHLAQRAGLEVRVYTVTHPWLVQLIVKLYPDVVIYTDRPERFTHLRETATDSTSTNRSQ
jgi:glycerophosphoryl diester phosphodiesterase